MQIDWNLKEVGKAWEPFGDWLARNTNLSRLSSAKENQRNSIIKDYLEGQGLLEVEVGGYKGKETEIRFKLAETGAYWHRTNWNGCYQRGLKKNKLEAFQTIIMEPLISDFMDARGTPLIRSEGTNNRRQIYFYSNRFNWICKQDWKTIRKCALKEDGSIAVSCENEWLHDFRSVCGQTEYVTVLLWEKFECIVDPEWSYSGPRSDIPCTSFDGIRHVFNLNRILTGNTVKPGIKSAEDKQAYIELLVAKSGYLKTGKCWELNLDFFDLQDFASNKPLPVNIYSDDYGWETYKVYLGHLGDEERVDKRLEGAWDRNKFIRERFKRHGYLIHEEWKYTPDGVEPTSQSSLNPIPFVYKNKWYRLTWSDFNGGIRVDKDNYLYLVSLRNGNDYVLTLGITQNEIYKRYTSEQLVKCFYKTERRPLPQMKEMERVMLYLTRKYSVTHLLPIGFDGRNECRSREMDVDKTIDKIKTVLADFDRKYKALPSVI